MNDDHLTSAEANLMTPQEIRDFIKKSSYKPYSYGLPDGMPSDASGSMAPHDSRGLFQIVPSTFAKYLDNGETLPTPEPKLSTRELLELGEGDG